MTNESKSRKVLVTGGSGYIGRQLVQMLSVSHEVVWTYHKNSEFASPNSVRLDIRNQSAVYKLISSLTPDFIFHLAYDQNDLEDCVIEGTKNVVNAWAGQGSGGRLVFVSTDAVFDGQTPPYSETSIPNPIYPYGRAKRTAELAALEKNAQLIRTSIVYGFDPPDFRTRALLSGARDGSFPHPYFTDEIRSPIFVLDLCRALLELMSSRLSEYRVLHIAGPEPVSRYDMALKLVQACSFGTTPPQSTLAKSGLIRPGDVALDVRLARSVLNTELRTIDQVSNKISLRKIQRPGT